jgi:hypothetical protein
VQQGLVGLDRRLRIVNSPDHVVFGSSPAFVDIIRPVFCPFRTATILLTSLAHLSYDLGPACFAHIAINDFTDAPCNGWLRM